MGQADAREYVFPDHQGQTDPPALIYHAPRYGETLEALEAMDGEDSPRRKNLAFAAVQIGRAVDGVRGDIGKHFPGVPDKGCTREELIRWISLWPQVWVQQFSRHLSRESELQQEEERTGSASSR